MATNVELYEALKPYVGQEAAGMIADVVPPARDLATKSDLDASKSELTLGLAAVRHDLDVGLAGVQQRIAEVEARLSQRLLTYFIPLWVMMGSMALAIVGLVATRA